MSADLSRFPEIADRLQQGILAFMLPRPGDDPPAGLLVEPGVRRADRHQRLFYAGASLGGIIGGALTSVAPDFDRSALIVPGLRFSLLLTRSTQFPTFGSILYGKYPDPVEQALVNSMIQLLWDRGEANGYVYHMVRDPLPNTPVKTVLLHEAFGDHQVSNVATETEARIIGARLRTPRSTRAAAATGCPSTGSSGSRATRGRATRSRSSTSGRCAVGDLRARRRRRPRTSRRTIGVDPHPITATELNAVFEFSDFLKIGGAFVRPLPERQALLRGRLDGAMRTLLAIAAAGVVALATAAPAAASGLRPDRPVALPLPVAERLLPRARPAGADGVDDADERSGHADRAGRLQLLGRLQPRRADRDQGARASTRPRRFAKTGAVPITDLARTYDRTRRSCSSTRARCGAS